MKMTVKSLLLTIVISTLFLSSFSQPRLALANPLASDIRKIIRDYPQQSGSLQGDIIVENPQTTTYNCTF
ncbi:MAG: hypothetical protein ACXWWD_00730 [Chitinophagaceae bacterium]